MGKSKNTRKCPKCGGANDSKSGGYCKRCSVSYQMERMRINAGKKCAVPGCRGRRSATSAYCKACRSKRGKKYHRELFAKMTKKQLAEFKRKQREYLRAYRAAARQSGG